MAFSRRQTTDDSRVRRLNREELAGIITAARAVNEADDEDSTLRVILREAIGLLSADEGSVLLYERDRRSLTIRVARGIDEDIARTVRIPRGHGIAGSVAASGKPVLLGPGDGLGGYERDYERARPLRSSVCVPLTTRGNVQGVLNLGVLGSNEEHPGFDDQDLALATIFGEQAAAAVHARRLIAAAQRRRREVERLYEAGVGLSRAQDVGSVASLALEAAMELGDATGGMVALTDTGVWRLAAVEGVHRGRAVATVRQTSFAATATAAGLRVIEDCREDETLSALAPGDEPVAAAVVPLVDETAERPVGALITLHDRPPEDAARQRVAALASQASLALSKALVVRHLESKEDELTRLIYAIPDPVLLVDGEGRFLAINPAAGEQFRLDDRFVAGTVAVGRLGSEALDEMLTVDRAAKREITLEGPPARTYRARVSLVSPELRGDSARILILEDVTTEAENRQLQSDFVAVIGHELRTPLTLIKGYASTLSRDDGRLTPELRDRAISSLTVHTARLERLIEDLLLVSRIERGRPPLKLAHEDVVQVIREGIEAARREHPDREINWVTDVASLEAPVDSIKVEQVLHHLITNAVKFSEPPAAVEVRFTADEETMRIAVRDRGIGIFSGDIPKMFDRFKQIDGTETRHHGGTGIGLYICRTLVEAHGGRIEVRSALGKGSTFTVLLPRHADDLADVEHVVGPDPSAEAQPDA